MKKRASLLISGITTAALIVTAIGSFAAWDTLTATSIALTAKSGSPAVMAVTATPKTQEGKVLVPVGAAKGTGEVTELDLGTVTSTYKTVDNVDKGNGATISYTQAITLKNTPGTNLESYYTVSFYEEKTTGVYDPTETALGALKVNKTYQVKLKYKDSATNIVEGAVTATAGKDVDVTLTGTAVNNN